MRIAFNPSTVEALIAPPNNKDITFDLRGHNIFARGVKFCGTDTWRPVVDNLTSDSTTSSLSANQGRVLAGLINGKSDSGHNHDDRYLKLTGGTMTSNALITFADSSSWDTNKGPQGAGGGLYWTGQSDYAKLYAEETAGDNLDLVIQFGDDNSNGLSIRNKDNTQTSYISAGGVITTGTFKGNLDWSYITNKPATATRWPSWDEITNKPNTFTPSDHNHDYLIVNAANEESFNSAYHNFLVLYAGGDNGIAGRPSGVDAFGLIKLRAAYGWSGQMLLANGGSLYIRSSEDANMTSTLAWRTILDSSNYSSILDSRYYTESEVNTLLDTKLDRQNLSYGTWNPRGYSLAADYQYNGGDLSISESGGLIHVSVDGYFWLNEGLYRVLDTSDVAGLKNNLTVHLHLSNTDTTWYPLIWGGSSHNNTSDSTGEVYKSHDVLSWLTSSLTLYATNLYTGRLETINNHYYRFDSDSTLRIYANSDSNQERIYFLAGIDNRIDDYDISSYGGELRHSIILNPRGGFVGIGDTNPSYKLSVGGDTKITGSIRSLAIGGGIYWNPYVESTTDGSDAASITLVKSGVAGGTTLVLSLMNDANDTILFQTNDSARLYHNSYQILTTLNTYVSNNKGYINGTEITLVNNADTVDGYHATSGRTFDGNINWSPNWNDTWSDGTNNHPWYGFDHRYPNTGAYSTTITDYFGMTIKTANTLRLDFGKLLLNGTSIYSINVESATKLQTARLLWGQSFNGTADVNGTIYINNDNSSNGAIRLNNNVNSNARISAIDDKIIFNTSNAIRFGETDWDWNQWAGLKYTHSNKTIYLGIADGSVFNSNSTLSGGTLNLRAGISSIDLNSGTAIRGLPTNESPYSSRVTLNDTSIYLSAYGDISMSTGPGTIELSSGYGGIELSCLGNNASIGSDIKILSSQGIYLNSKNSGNVYLCYGGGSVGIGTTSPAYKLHVEGNIYSNGGFHKNGSDNSYVLLGGGGHQALSDFASSSHSHNYAANENYGGFTKSGRLPISGFYQSEESESGGNAPWSSWMHLINCLHSNTNNNYALLIAASFYDNNTFKIRVTADNVNNAWRDIIHSGNIGSQSVNYASSSGNADTLDGYHYNQLPYIQRLNWWNDGDSHNANDLLSGTTFAYSTHSNCPTTGTIVAFNCINSTGYPLQLQGAYYGEELWFRNRNGDNGTWQTWRYVIHNGNIGSQSVNYANSAGNAETLGGMPKNYGQAPFNTIPCVSSDGVMEIGRYIDYHYDNSGNYDFSTRLLASGNNRNVVTLPSASGTLALTSYGGDSSHPIFLGYLDLDHGDDGTVSSSFYCLGYSVSFTYTRGGNYCKISIPDTSYQVFYIRAAIASVNYSGGGMDTWVGDRRGDGAWWLHCYAYNSNEVRVKGFCLRNSNNDSWWGGNPLWSGNSGANRITVCIFGYVTFR